MKMEDEHKAEMKGKVEYNQHRVLSGYAPHKLIKLEMKEKYLDKKNKEAEEEQNEIDLSQYIDKWIAIEDGIVIASGDSAKDVYLEALEKHPTKEPFIMKVPRNEATII